MKYLKIFISSMAILFCMVALQATANGKDRADNKSAVKNSAAVPNTLADEITRKMVIDSYGRMPISFIENQGQIENMVSYYTKLTNQSLYFTKEGIVFDLIKRKASARKDIKGDVVSKKREETAAERMVFSLNFNNTSREKVLTAADKLEGTVNYFIGDKENWKRDIPAYKEVVYHGIYEGIDLRVYGNGRELEYDFMVKPGADPQDILLSYSGIKGLTINRDGELVIHTSFGKLKECKPYIYQIIDGKRVEVEGRFVIRKRIPGNVKKEVIVTSKTNKEQRQQLFYAFNIGKYNPDYRLVIDPVLVYSTYLGGSSNDRSYGIAVDSSGNAYICGYTYSANFPTANAFDSSFNGGTYDAFVTKLNAAGNALIYSTYLGGGSPEEGKGIAVDNYGNAYICGVTSSSNFPTVNAIDSSYNGSSDVFVTKLNAAGNALVYSTYLGGSSGEQGYGITVDNSGNAYICGYTGSSDFPVVNAFDSSSNGSYDAFVTKLNAGGNSLVYSTYIGGSSEERGYGITVDNSSSAYICGYTSSTNFPTVNAVNNSHNFGADVFVTKLNAAGNLLVYSTYLGGSSTDEGYGITVDSSGNAYICGRTSSSNFPTVNAIDSSSNGSSDVFVTKLNAAGNALVYSTYLGGSSVDRGYGIVVDNSDNAYVCGGTLSSNFPVENAIDSISNGSYDAFVTKLNAAGSALAYSTYLGGSSTDEGYGIALDGAGNVYICGYTGSSDFPVVNAFDSFLNTGSTDVFVTKLGEESTVVELLSFMAESSRGDVVLNWETATEVDNAGFNLYRSRLRDGEYKKINDTLITAKGDATSGASYRYEDTPPSKGTYCYKLEDVDMNGASTMHGPEKVRVRK